MTFETALLENLKSSLFEPKTANFNPDRQIGPILMQRIPKICLSLENEFFETALLENLKSNIF